MARVSAITLHDDVGAGQAFAEFRGWADSSNVEIASCRLRHDNLRESMFLEDQGFRFVEMVLHPALDRLQTRRFEEAGIEVAPVDESDLTELQELAGAAFRHERYHVDPRLDPAAADRRYRNWVAAAFADPLQRLLAVRVERDVVGFFIVEERLDGEAHWHLTAIGPRYHGRGYGRRAWLAMLEAHRRAGLQSVGTTIAARNVPVLNLYASLGFRFLPPEMTFHWVRG